MSQRKKIAQHSQGAPKVMHVMFFITNGLVSEHPIPIGTIDSDQFYSALL